MKKINYYFAVCVALFITVCIYFEVLNEITALQLLLYTLLDLFLLIFGLYGLKAESLMKKFIYEEKTENFCIGAIYYAKNKGLIDKLFLFPFMKIKSKKSVVICFLGSTFWMVIILIVLKLFLK